MSALTVGTLRAAMIGVSGNTPVVIALSNPATLDDEFSATEISVEYKNGVPSRVVIS